MNKVKVLLQSRYSGQPSRRFWKRVNSLKGKNHEAAYDMGCMLQDLEGRVLRFINEILPEAKR